MATRSRKKKLLILLLVVGAVIALKLVLNHCLMAFAWRSGVLVTISKETTYITEPLRPDGYPDYIAALNNRDSKGVMPENNAVVPFFRAMGPDMVEAEFRDRYCKSLGIATPPVKGDYFVSFDKYVKALKLGKSGQRLKDDNDVWKQQDSAMKRPWRAEDLPVAAGWLAANRQPLDLVVEASKRPRWFSPVVSEEGIFGARMTATNRVREAVRALESLAMQRLQDGKLDQAWADTMAIHRLARLASQGPTLIDGLVAISLDSMAFATDQALLQHAHLTAAQARKMRADLAALPPMAKMSDKLDVSERFMTLDIVAMLARGKNLEGGSDSTIAHPAGLDWDAILRITNKWYDGIVAAARQPTRTERWRAYVQIDVDLEKQINAVKSWKSLVWSVLGNPRTSRSKLIGFMMVSLHLLAVEMAMNAEDRGNMTFDVNTLAFVLAEYRAQHGSYPAKLAELAPKYVATVPKDTFSGGALHYKPHHVGYLLYSVGPNGKDDGGRNREDNADDVKLEGCDDIAVRVPSKSE